MRPQHGDMVGDRARVAGADADVDHGDAAPVGPGQVVGRHLRQARPATGPSSAPGAGAELTSTTSPGATKRSYSSPSAIACAGEGAEMLDVALVVGQQHEALEVLRVRAGVVVEPLQAVVDALGGEQRQRRRLAAAGAPGAVGDVVVGVAEVGHREQVLQLVQLRAGQAAADLLDHERQRDRPVADAGHQRDRRGCGPEAPSWVR